MRCHVSACVYLCVSAPQAPHPMRASYFICQLSGVGQTVNGFFVPNQPGGLSRFTSRLDASLCVGVCDFFLRATLSPSAKTFTPQCNMQANQ